MKQSVSPGVIAVVAVVLVAIIGFAAYKTFGPKNAQSSSLTPKQAAMRDAMAKAAAGPHTDMKTFTKDNRPPGSGGGQ
jgi:hypothetical protein